MSAAAAAPPPAPTYEWFVRHGRPTRPLTGLVSLLPIFNSKILGHDIRVEISDACQFFTRHMNEAQIFSRTQAELFFVALLGSRWRETTIWIRMMECL